jgi:PAS domain S-box-containing protein
MSLGRPEGGWEPAFWTVFERTRNAMLLLDDARVIVDANPAFAELLGYSRSELIDTPVFDLIPPEEHEDVRQAWQLLRSAGEGTNSRTLLARDGRRVTVQYASVLSEVPERGQLGVYVAIDVTAHPEELDGDPPAQDVPQLTAREHEVVQLVALGKTGGEIAAELGVSHETIRTHVRNAMAKTGTRTRAQLVAQAFADRLIQR